jgi:hypothetical protein
MLSHRHRHRHRARRLFAALLAAVAVVATSVMFLSAPPASADEPPPSLRLKIDNAVRDANNALLRPECNALLSGGLSTGFAPAFLVLNSARTEFQPVPPPPRPTATTVATVPFVGAGLNQPIRIHNAFDQIGVTGTLPFGGRPAMATNNFDVVRAVVILHEVGHLTGIEGDHEARTDAAGRTISAAQEEALYNTRILNTCFAPRGSYRIGQASCQQTFNTDLGVIYSTLDCNAVCRPDAGPVVVAWTSSLQSTITTDTITDDNGSKFCHSTRVSNCPPPNDYVSSSPNGAFALFPPTDITLTITDASGHVSQDTFRITCIDPNPNYGW